MSPPCATISQRLEIEHPQQAVRSRPRPPHRRTPRENSRSVLESRRVGSPLALSKSRRVPPKPAPRRSSAFTRLLHRRVHPQNSRGVLECANALAHFTFTRQLAPPSAFPAPATPVSPPQ